MKINWEAQVFLCLRAGMDFVSDEGECDQRDNAMTQKRPAISWAQDPL